ncbi:endonuclease domain-containing protein [Owenweeksia hongkongensis]|uniref:endonuclease domain-containing protein n=1 Tax=Owenweeksia hongkongensis TaxID=253245 RepID=UPI003A94BFB3
MPKSNMHHKAEGDTFKFARMLRQEFTEAEDKLWQKVRGRRLGAKFRRQHPIDKFIVDFYCFDKKLIIEVDGGIHLTPEVKENDKQRQTLIESLGYRFLRFTNNEVMNDIDLVLERIKVEINNI